MTIELSCIIQAGMYIVVNGIRYYPPKKSKYKSGDTVVVTKLPIPGVTLNSKTFVIVKDIELWVE